jgi:NAD kinase
MIAKRSERELGDFSRESDIMKAGHPIIAVVTRETRLAGLKARWATTRQAAFRLQQAAAHEVELRRKRLARVAAVDDQELAIAAGALADEDEYEDEDRTYQRSVQQLLREIDLGYPVKTVDRGFLPNFDFGRCLVVVVIGQDGLVANAAKYVGALPIIGINPDPARNDGVLLPFEVRDARAAVLRAIDAKAKTRDVTLAEVNTNDGQRMLAFNDFFVGASSHISARYTLEADGRSESQSSSGVLVSTGAGSTGWLSSLFNMTQGIGRIFGTAEVPKPDVKWEDRRLIWAVREPFRSRHSGTELVAGVLAEGHELVIGSQMPANGVIFSDGVEADFLEFNSGTICRFTVSPQRARLVIP